MVRYGMAGWYGMVRLVPGGNKRGFGTWSTSLKSGKNKHIPSLKIYGNGFYWRYPGTRSTSFKSGKNEKIEKKPLVKKFWLPHVYLYFKL